MNWVANYILCCATHYKSNVRPSCWVSCCVFGTKTLLHQHYPKCYHTALGQAFYLKDWQTINSCETGRWPLVMIVYKQFRKNPSCLQPPWIKHINAFIWASCADMAGPIKMTSHLSKKIIHNMWRQFHCTHLERNGLEFNYRAKISPLFFSSGLRAISTNKMSWSSATMWPSNNTWLWLHLLMGEKWVFYITVISVRVDRAKTLNPPFQFAGSIFIHLHPTS